MVVTQEVVKEVIKEVEVVKEVEVIKEVEKIVEVARPEEEKVLRVRMVNMPAAFNPHTGGSGAVTIVLGWTFSRLVQPGPATGTWAPDLAAGWEVNEDATEYTFYLQKHAKWHDGTPVTANDVAFTVKSLLHPQSAEWMVNTYISVKGAKAYQEGNAMDVEGIQIVDDYTIKLTMERPNVTFLDELVVVAALSPAPILPEHALKDIPDDQLFEHDFWSQGLMGSGPFKFVSWVPQQAMVLEANRRLLLRASEHRQADPGDHPLQRRDPDRPAARGGRYDGPRRGVAGREQRVLGRTRGSTYTPPRPA